MKTNSVTELLKAKGIRVEKSSAPPEREKPVPTKRKRLYQTHVEDKKVEKKWRQTEDKVESKAGSNQRQSRDKVETATKGVSLVLSESRDKVESQPETEAETKWRQTEDKVETSSSLSNLVGLQRKLIIFLYRSCKAARSSTTEPLAIEHISKSCGTSASSAKKTLQRLEQKAFLTRSAYRDGRGGWTKYELGKDIFQDLLRAETEDKLETKWRHTGDKVATQPETQPRTSPSSSSRDLIIKEPTTTQPVDAFAYIDLGLVQPFGITSSVLARCTELYPNLQPEQLEGLVFRFAEFAKDPKNKVQNARGFFISLAEQASKGQIPLDHIETPDERLMRLFVEREKEAKTRRVEVEQAAREFEFEAWIETQTMEMKLSLIPETPHLKAGSAPHMAMLKNHFVENVWPARRKRILHGEANP